MAARLASTVGGDVEIITETFERAPLPQHSFDLAVAATASHWGATAAARSTHRTREGLLSRTDRGVSHPITGVSAARMSAAPVRVFF